MCIFFGYLYCYLKKKLINCLAFGNVDFENIILIDFQKKLKICRYYVIMLVIEIFTRKVCTNNSKLLEKKKHNFPINYTLAVTKWTD